MGDTPLTKFKALRYRLEYCAVEGLARAVPHLARPAALALARLLGALAYRIDTRGRRTAEANLRATVGQGWAPGRVDATVAAAYSTFARTVVDLFWSPNLAGGGYRRWMVLERDGAPPVDEVPQGIWVTPHLGNFEWLSQHARYLGIPLLVVAEDFKNPALTPVFSQLRSVGDHAVIPQDKAMLRLIRHLKRGGHAAFLTDLTVKPDQGAAVVECFGLKTSVTAAPAFLAQRSGLPLIPAYSIPHPDGRYSTVVTAPIETANRTPAEICQAVWDRFEPVVRRRPELWLWMYKHWRYRPPGPEGERYPPYANRSKPFDRLLDETGRG